MINFRQNNQKQVLRTLIIDDEAHVRESLTDMLKHHCPNAKLIGQADGVKSGLLAIKTSHPDLVLLDIKMKDGTGFDLLEKIENVDFKIIFVTAFDEFAIKAIKFSALDYLLKPVDPEDLVLAVGKADDITQSELKTKLDTLSNNLKTTDQSNRKIILKTHDNIYLVGIQDIIHIEGDGSYSTVFLASGDKVMLSVTLKHYHELLEEHGFFRVHKSHLINLEHIYRFEKADGGYIILDNEARIPVAVRKKDELIELFDRMTT